MPQAFVLPLISFAAKATLFLMANVENPLTPYLTLGTLTLIFLIIDVLLALYLGYCIVKKERNPLWCLPFGLYCIPFGALSDPFGVLSLLPLTVSLGYVFIARMLFWSTK